MCAELGTLGEQSQGSRGCQEATNGWHRGTLLEVAGEERQGHTRSEVSWVVSTRVCPAGFLLTPWDFRSRWFCFCSLRCAAWGLDRLGWKEVTVTSVHRLW